ncbi:MAG: quinone-dependent dihydroorotate dehydrogenase, partial [Patescibacteria group bacterium]
IIGFLYRNIFKNIFFKIDPEITHDRAVQMGRILGSNIFFKKAVSFCLNFSDPALKQNICGITFENPIGLAAGFDKNAEIIEIMPSVGFGFTEIGSITGQSCLGNLKPRLWRLPKSKGLVVHYGLNNDGAEVISKRLIKKNQQINKIPLGINIAKTNSSDIVGIEKEINDYLKGIQAFLNIGDYLAINISCPNAYGGQPFTDPDRLNLLFQEINKLNIKKPVFLKMAPDLSFEIVDKIIELAEQYHISGFICSNITKNRNNPKIILEEINQVPVGIGGISGKPSEEMTNNLITYVYKKTKGEKIIIGCGGIFSAEDAYKKIRLGSSLLQLITGIIFEGPQLISEINIGLCNLLKKDGFKNINEAIGIDFK